VVDGCLTNILSGRASSDRRDCQPEPGDGIDGAGRNYSRQRLWTVTLPVGPAT
jgi:hypothetical protein